MLLMDYPSIIGGDLPDFFKVATWKLLYAYIDAHSKILIDEYHVDEAQDITVLQSKCENTTSAEQIRYNRLFQKVIHKERESAINYINRFQNDKALVISVGNSYSKDHLMHTFLDNFQQGGNILLR